MTYKQYREIIASKFRSLATNGYLYKAVDRDKIVEIFLSGFTEEQRQEFNCSSCKSFLRQIGGVVGLVNNKPVSIFDVEVDELYQPSTTALKEYVDSLPITDYFLYPAKVAGVDVNFDSERDLMWNHFFLEIPSNYREKERDIPSKLAERRSKRDVFFRALSELTPQSLEIVLELISQNSLYRGNEFRPSLVKFQELQREFLAMPDDQRDGWSYITASVVSPAVASIRNSAIGTLLIDLSSDVDLETAVTKFEKVVAPTNYKRTSALVTPKMLEAAKATVTELSLASALYRRFANESDIPSNHLLFKGDRIVTVPSPFDNVTTVKPKPTLSKVEEIPVADFINNVIPKASKIEALVENRHLPNLVTLLTETNPNSGQLFKWDSPISWSYSGGVADSMKERVKSAGGNVEGELRFSIQWNDDGNNDIDFDAHCIEPKGGDHIYFGTFCRPERSKRGGQLDVDIINPGKNIAVENITYPKLSIKEGEVYKFYVNNYSSYTSKGGFSAEIELLGQIHSFVCEKNLRGAQNVQVATVVCENGQVKVVPAEGITHGTSSIQKWKLETSRYYKVSHIMNSPNHWEGSSGNKHLFFILSDAVCDEKPRAMLNEFLRQDLEVHRKVFELLGGSIQIAETDNQLSGLGFSETVRNELIVKVSGQITRELKIKF